MMRLAKFMHVLLMLSAMATFQVCALPEISIINNSHSVAWRSVGPGGGGWIQSIAFDPQDPKVFYVGCDVGGFYITSDFGKSYAIQNQGLSDLYIQAIAIHPRNPKTILLGTPSGIQRSADQGRSWEWIRAGFPPVARYSFSSPIGAICFDPQNPHVVYAGIGRPREGKSGQGAIYRSDDMGITWKNISQGQLPSDAIVSDLKVKPNDSKVILAATHKGIFRSEDDGQTFHLSSQGLPHLHAAKIAFADSSPNVAYATLLPTARDGQPWNGGIYRSEDAGKTWKSANGEGMPMQVGKSGESAHMTSAVVEIAVDPRNHDLVYAGNRDWVTAGVKMTCDGGKHWVSLYLPPGAKKSHDYGWITQWGPSVQSFALSPGNPEHLVFGTSGHVFVSEDGGKSWDQRYTQLGPDGRFAGTGLEVTCLHNVIPDPVRPERIYFCYLDIGLLLSEDGGRSFKRSSQGMRGECFTVVVDPIILSKWWAGIGEWGRNVGGVGRSEDDGKTWRMIGSRESGLPVGQTKHLVLDLRSPLESRRLLVTSRGNGIFESKDGGLHWHCINGDLPPGAMKEPRGLLLDPADSGHILLTLGGTPQDGAGIYETRNAGANWARLNSEPVFANITCLAHDGHGFETLYVGAREFRDPSTGTLYKGGLFRSGDGGRSWNRILDYHFIGTVAVSPADPEVLYVGTTDHPYHDNWVAEGVLKSSNGGLTWHQENGGLTHMNITSLSISPHDPSILYLGTGGNGAFIGRDTGVGRPTTGPIRSFVRLNAALQYLHSPTEF